MLNLFRLFLPAGLFLLSFSVNAGEVLSSENDQGYQFTLPVVTVGQLTNEIHSVKADLAKHREELVQVVADSTLTGAEVVIAIIAPGGMLYAANEANKKNQAEQKITMIDEDVAALEKDLVYFSALNRSSPVLLARAQ